MSRRSIATLLAAGAFTLASCARPLPPPPSLVTAPMVSTASTAPAAATAPAPAAATPDAGAVPVAPGSQDAGAWACPVKARWSLRLRYDRPPYEAEWRRCPKAVHDPVGDWDVDALAVRDPARNGDVVWSTTNADEPTERWLEDVEPTHFGSRGEEPLFVLTRIAGTGHAGELCVLGAVAGGVGCWPEPATDLDRRFERLLSRGESPHNCQVALLATGLGYRCGIARPGDANCCPSGGALHASAAAADGHFVIDRVWRTAEE